MMLAFGLLCPCWRPAAAARARWWTRRSATAPRCWPPPITASCATATGSTAGKPTCWMAARTSTAAMPAPTANMCRSARSSQFYRLLLERCGIDDPEFQRQWDRAQWPALRQAGGGHRRQDARRMVRAARRQRRLLRPGARFRRGPGPSATPRAQLRRDRRHAPPGAGAPAVAHAWAGAADSAPGQHTEELLTGLGWSRSDIQALRERGAIA